jgi:hypothetical protein
MAMPQINPPQRKMVFRRLSMLFTAAMACLCEMTSNVFADQAWRRLRAPQLNVSFQISSMRHTSSQANCEPSGRAQGHEVA